MPVAAIKSLRFALFYQEIVFILVKQDLQETYNDT